MGVNKNDLRVIKTRRGLREALVRLLMREEYDSISIQDIADEAEAARMTFYRHYRNKEELLVDCLNATYEGLAERVEHPTEAELRQGNSPVLAFYKHILEQETLYLILFSNRGTQTVVDQLRKYMADRAMQQITDRFPGAKPQAPLEIIAYHIASAQIGLAAWWLENGKPYPPEYMAQVSFWLNMAGSVRGLGLENLAVSPPPFPGSED